MIFTKGSFYAVFLIEMSLSTISLKNGQLCDFLKVILKLLGNLSIRFYVIDAHFKGTVFFLPRKSRRPLTHSNLKKVVFFFH